MNEDEKMQVHDDFEEINPENEKYFPDGTSESKNPETFNQLELNDLVRDLGLSKLKAEYLSFVLKEKI